VFLFHLEVIYDTSFQKLFCIHPQKLVYLVSVVFILFLRLGYNGFFVIALYNFDSLVVFVES
jgi:hypothetical protein